MEIKMFFKYLARKLTLLLAVSIGICTVLTCLSKKTFLMEQVTESVNEGKRVMSLMDLEVINNYTSSNLNKIASSLGILSRVKPNSIIEKNGRLVAPARDWAVLGGTGGEDLLCDMSIFDGIDYYGDLVVCTSYWRNSNYFVPEKIEIHTFGIQNKSDLNAENLELREDGSKFTAISTKQKLNIKVPVGGEHFVYNALCATQVGYKLGISNENIIQGIEQFELTKRRMEINKLENGAIVINDAYNASPTSMKAALEYFADIEIEGEKVVVLGDILELGEASKTFHEGIADAIQLDRFKAVYLYGEEMKALYEKFVDEEKVQHFLGTKDTLTKAIKETTNAGDAVLFKSSNGTDLLSVVDRLKLEKD